MLPLQRGPGKIAEIRIQWLGWRRRAPLERRYPETVPRPWLSRMEPLLDGGKDEGEIYAQNMVFVIVGILLNWSQQHRKKTGGGNI